MQGVSGLELLRVNKPTIYVFAMHGSMDIMWHKLYNCLEHEVMFSNLNASHSVRWPAILIRDLILFWARGHMSTKTRTAVLWDFPVFSLHFLCLFCVCILEINLKIWYWLRSQTSVSLIWCSDPSISSVFMVEVEFEMSFGKCLGC